MKQRHLSAILMRNREGCAGGGKGPLLSEERSLTLATNNDQVLFCSMDQGGGIMNVESERTGTLRAQTHGHEPLVSDCYAVRRLTPTECERLQGFPDDWTKVPYKGKPTDECPDGPRYKALGNSMAVPVMKWIGERIQKVEDEIS